MPMIKNKPGIIHHSLAHGLQERRAFRVRGIRKNSFEYFIQAGQIRAGKSDKEKDDGKSCCSEREKTECARIKRREFFLFPRNEHKKRIKKIYSNKIRAAQNRTGKGKPRENIGCAAFLFRGDKQRSRHSHKENAERIIAQRVDAVRRIYRKSKRTGGRAQRMIASQTQINCGCHKALHCHIQIPQRKINACGAAGQPGKKQHGKIQQHTGELRHMPFVNEQPVALCQPVGNCRIKRFVRLSKAVPAAPAEKNRRETK